MRTLLLVLVLDIFFVLYALSARCEGSRDSAPVAATSDHVSHVTTVPGL